MTPRKKMSCLKGQCIHLIPEKVSTLKASRTKPPEATKDLDDRLHPGVLPGDSHLLQLPEKHPSICCLGFLVQFAELEQLKLKLSRRGAGEEFHKIFSNEILLVLPGSRVAPTAGGRCCDGRFPFRKISQIPTPLGLPPAA